MILLHEHKDGVATWECDACTEKYGYPMRIKHTIGKPIDYFYRFLKKHDKHESQEEIDLDKRIEGYLKKCID